MKVEFDTTAGRIADELVNDFMFLNPYQSNPQLRQKIAIQSALATVQEIRRYSETYLMSDDFFKQVKKCLLIKLNETGR